MSVEMKDCSIDATDAAGKTELWHAIERANTNDFERLLKCGADVNKTYQRKQTPLMLAVEKGHLNYLKPLIKAGADIDSVDSYGMSALMIAAKKGNIECLQMLANSGANLHFRDIRGRSGLLIAVEENSCECAKYLIHAGVDIYKYDSKGVSAIMAAIHVNCANCVKSLVQAGAPLNEFNKSGKSPLMIAAERDSSVLPVLIQLGAEVDKKDSRGRTAVVYAAREGCTQGLMLLVQAGANLDITDYRGQTALMIVSETGQVNCADCLVKSGAKLELQDKNGRTALMLAASNGHHEIVEIILKHCDQCKDLQCKYKKTALIYAVVGSNEDSVRELNLSVTKMFKLYPQTQGASEPSEPKKANKSVFALLAAGANPNISDDYEMTALLYAAVLDKTGEYFEALVAARADIDFITKCYRNEKTALLLAACQANTKYVKKLVEYGAPVNRAAVNGDTPLLYLALNSYKPGVVDTIAFLLDHGADVNAEDQAGLTPLMCVIRNPNATEVMSLLIKHGADVNKVDKTGYCILDHTIARNDDLLENAKFLLENGAKSTVSSTGNVKSSINLAIKNENISFIKLLLNKNLESVIDWDDFSFLLTQKKLLRAVVSESVLPYFNVPSLKRIGNSGSILKAALDKTGVDVAKYFLVAGYMNIHDIYREQPELKKIESGAYLGYVKEERPFFTEIYSQPWPLVKLAFVVASSNMGESSRRKLHIENSGLPDRLKRMLLFQEPISKLCESEWSTIPLCFDPQEYEKLPTPRPLLYYWPFGQELIPCDCSNCSESGYKFASK